MTKSTEKVMCAFEAMLNQGSKAIKGKRASLIFNKVKDEQEETVRAIKRQIDEIEYKLLDISDLAPESELSLRVAKKDFDSKQWVKEVHDLKLKKAELSVELEIANETMDEWFGVEETAE